MIAFWVSSEISSDPKDLFTLFWKPIEDKPTPQTWQFTLVGQGDGSIGEDLAWEPEFDSQNTCKKKLGFIVSTFTWSVKEGKTDRSLWLTGQPVLPNQQSQGHWETLFQKARWGTWTTRRAGNLDCS